MRTSLVLALSLAACQAPDPADPASAVETPDAPAVIEPHGDPVTAGPIVGIERIDVHGHADGGFAPGMDERFRAVLDVPEEDVLEVTWTASDGTVVSEGLEVLWTLPETEVASLELTVRTAAGTSTSGMHVQLISVVPGATGRVDPTSDDHGSFCDLVIDSSDVPHIVYRNDIHQQWWYAKFVGGLWVRELIDGPGFGVGGRAYYTWPSLALDRNGVPHVALLNSKGTTYAKRTGGVWTVETVAVPTVYTGSWPNRVSLVLDAANNDAPILADTIYPSSSLAATRITRKVGGNWTSSTSALTSNDDVPFRGGLVSTASNTVRFVADDDGLEVIQWSQAGGFTAVSAPASGPSSAYSDYYDNDDRVQLFKAGTAWGALWESGLSWNTTGTTWDLYAVEAFVTYVHDVEWDGTEPRIAVVHSGNLEFMRPDARDYWGWTVVDTGVDSDAGGPSTALDSGGNLHACYSKYDILYFF